MRTQYVKIAGCSSYSYTASTGIAQGGHLGPLLFLLFINDAVNCFQFSKCLLYADDMKIYAHIKTLSDTELFQQDLSNFCTWTVQNKLPLNVDKCKIMTFCKARNPRIEFPYVLFEAQLTRVSLTRDLGVIFTTDLSFNKHIDYIIGKGFSMLGLIKRHGRDFQDPYTLKTLFVTYVRSILEYASVIWKPYYQIHSDRLESVQKQFLIFALRRLPSSNTDRYALAPYENRLKLINLQSVSLRRELNCVIFARDVFCSRIDCSAILSEFGIAIPRLNLRTRHAFFRLPFCRTNFSSSEPSITILSAFNDYYALFDFNISRQLFKKAIASC